MARVSRKNSAAADAGPPSPITKADLVFLRRESLTPAERDAVRKLAAPRIAEFDDLLRDWEACLSTIEVVWNRTADEPVGLIAWSGATEVTASWWIAHRGEGLGRRAAELLARTLVRHGAETISPLPILEGHRVASGRMAKHLRRVFARERREAIQSQRHHDLRHKAWQAWIGRRAYNPYFAADDVVRALADVDRMVQQPMALWMSDESLGRTKFKENKRGLGLWVHSRLMELRPLLETAWRRGHGGEPPALLTRDAYPTDFNGACGTLHRFAALADEVREHARPFETMPEGWVAGTKQRRQNPASATTTAADDARRSRANAAALKAMAARAVEEKLAEKARRPHSRKGEAAASIAGALFKLGNERGLFGFSAIDVCDALGWPHSRVSTVKDQESWKLLTARRKKLNESREDDDERSSSRSRSGAPRRVRNGGG